PGERPAPRPRRRGVPGRSSEATGRVRREPPRLSRENPRTVRGLVPPAKGASGPAGRGRSMGVIQAARDARLPAPRRDGAPEPRPSGGAGRPALAAPAARRLRPDRPEDDDSRGPRGDALLPALSRAREGLLREGLLRREDVVLGQ